MADDFILYGAEMDPAGVRGFLEHVFDANLAQASRGRRGTPICIWGTHGLGKTMVVRDFARERGWRFAYCAPAQFEEMGDLHGLPTRVDPDPTFHGDEYTAFLPPEWVPTEEGPGILLLDDINRADDRILRGLMQLLQNFEMFSWGLPQKWQIVATANPEGGDYSVTPMDDAMLTRMLHVTMVFDVKAWARWALEAGVDPRGVDFVLTYPEVVQGARTTPRSLTQFFEQIAPIEDLAASLDLVTALAASALDELGVTTFVAFVKDGLERLLSPDDILGAIDFDPVAKRLTELAGKGGATSKRLDRLATMCTRVVLELGRTGYQVLPRHKENLVAFMLHPALPADLRFSMHRDIVNGPEVGASLVKDPRLASIVLEAL